MSQKASRKLKSNKNMKAQLKQQLCNAINTVLYCRHDRLVLKQVNRTDLNLPVLLKCDNTDCDGLYMLDPERGTIRRCGLVVE